MQVGKGMYIHESISTVVLLKIIKGWRCMYNRLIEKLEQTTFPGRGIEENWIIEAEEELGFTLPPSYC